MSTVAITPDTQRTSLWFLDTLVTVRLPHDAGIDGISILESYAPYGDSPPRHVHATEDEVFHVLEGELLLEVDGECIAAPAGTIALAPKGVAHTYRVVSHEGARWLNTTTNGDFEAMVRGAARPAARDGLPVPSGPPSPDQVAVLAAHCAAHGITLVGPPLTD